MLNIVSVRVDDRLIHGCTAAVWMPFLKATKIIAVDNKTAADDFLCEIMKLSSTSKNVDIFTVNQAVSWYEEHKEQSDEQLFIIVKSIDQAVSLHDKGIPYTRLQLGTIVSRKDTTHKIQEVNFSDAEKEMIDRLVRDDHVQVEFQYNPQVKCIPWESSF